MTEVKWPSKYVGKYELASYHQGWNACHDAFMKVIEAQHQRLSKGAE